MLNSSLVTEETLTTEQTDIYLSCSRGGDGVFTAAACQTGEEEAIGSRIITQGDFVFHWSQQALTVIICADET